ncbi:amidohydrolase family protein [Micromonospora sp. NPDC050795]|uniref:amidohydrolase family protein n=1 Tax=Micromonospora sp. NPDC050795 TaxID=3364282 RepID=UPI00378D4DF0
MTTTRPAVPSLVDAHVHLCADAGPDALGRLVERPESDLDDVVEASLRTHLAAGVTTVRDLGDRRDVVLRWRDRRVRDDLPTVVRVRRTAARGTRPGRG